MDEKKLLSGRIKELSEKAYFNNYVTSTNFLSASELAMFYDITKATGIYGKGEAFNGAGFCIYGGREDADRNVVCFLPTYLDGESFLLMQQNESDILSCIHITPVNSKFADELNHRDYLGALMNLGIERDMTGDIMCDENNAYIYVMKDIAPLICKELIRIKHTSVKCIQVQPSECTLQNNFEEIEGSVASERLDAILAFVYKLSRSEAQEYISNEQVYVNGRTAFSGGYDLKKGTKVSVRGKGKFIYDGIKGNTRKGRLFVTVRIYK
ncbi:MAG: RNA-binding protein [Butyrivibrio sp.]|nr:RNA-binding protein [Butyrivibrio sp.]